MLRGVNLGSHNRLSMEALKTLYTSVGLEDARTYVQSGNVLFKTGERNLVSLADKIVAGIETQFSVPTQAILRTRAELKKVVNNNPFAGRPEIHPSKLLIVFTAADPAPEIRSQILAINIEPEELRFQGRELYIYFPNGMARPKLSIPRIERMLHTPCTGRNWNSVTKMLEMAEQMEANR